MDEREGKVFEQFLNTVVHELKTPVNEIRFLSEFVEEDNAGRLKDQSVEDLSSIRRTCDSMIDMIKDLLDYSRSQTGEIESAPLDMSGMVSQYFTRATRMLPKDSMTLTFGEMVDVIADRRLMKNVVKNILYNSVKYRRTNVKGEIHVSCVRRNGMIEFHFRDNGIGFDQKHAQQILEPFVRLHNEEAYEGNGLGLAIVRQAMERLGGKIYMQGWPDEGCLVVISLPESRIYELKEKELSETVKIGIIGDETGIAKVEERGKTFAYRLAAEEINAAGGILGRQVELIFRDSASDNEKTEAAARELTEKERVDVLMGSTLSPSRDIIIKAAERTRTLYLNTQQTEGGVAGHYVFCLSADPEQQLRAMLEYLLTHFGPKCYIVAADYNYGILTAEWAKVLVREYGGEVIGTEYFDEKITDFRPVIERIKQLNTDILVSICVYPNQDAFYEQWHEAGLNHIPNATTQIAAEFDQNARFDPPVLENTYVMASFLEESKSEAARKYVEKYRKKVSFEDVPYMNMDSETAYTALYIYKMACEMAGTTDAEAVIEVLESGEIAFDGPGGMVRVRGEDHHTVREFSCWRLDDRHQLEELFHTEPQSSDYIETMILQKTGRKGGIRALGPSAGTIRYNMLINKIVH